MNFRFANLLSHVTKIWKTVFPKEFFSKIGLKVIENNYKYIYIAEKKLLKKKKYSIKEWQPKQFLVTPPKC